MSPVQRRREKRNLRSKIKRAFLNNGGTRTKARALAPFTVGERRLVLRRIASGTMARESLKGGVRS